MVSSLRRPLPLPLPLLALIALACAEGEPPIGGILLQVPEEILFEDVSAGVTSLAPLPIHNPSPTGVRITGIRAALDFTADAYAFGVELEPERIGANETIIGRVTFFPRVTLEEPVRSSFVIETNARPVEVRVRGRTLAPALRLLPERLDFGVVGLGGSSERTVEVTNLLARPVVVKVDLDERGEPRVDHLGGAGRFELDGSATKEGAFFGGLPLEPGESGTIELRYHRSRDPDSPADRARTTLSACDRPECDVTLTMSASSEATALVCAPPSIDFGSVRPSDRRVASVDCVNRTGEPVRVSAALSGGSDPSFVLDPVEQLELLPAEHVIFEVTFAPLEAQVGGRWEGALAIESDRRDQSVFLPISIPLAGEASRASIEVSPPRIDFGSIAAGTRGRRRLTLSNRGGSTLRVSPEAPEPFALEVAGPLEIRPGDSIDLAVWFEPAAVGVGRGELVLSSNDPERPQLPILLEGEGIDLPPCEYRADASVELGAIERPRVGRRTIALENTGTVECLFKDFEATPPFYVVNGPPEGLVEPGARVEILLEARPRQGTNIGRLAFYASTPGGAPEIALSAEGTTLGLVASPPAIDFGASPSGCLSRSRVIDLFNGGTAPIQIDRIDVVGDPGFVLAVPAKDSSLDPGERTSIEVAHGGGLGGLARLEVRSRRKQAPLIVDLSADPAGSSLERFVVPEAADVLFVIDADAAVPHASIAAAFDAFVGPANAAGVDWQTGVITTDSLANGCAGPPSGLPETSTTTGACGFLANGARPDWRLITKSTAPSPAGAFAALASVGSGGLDPPAAFSAAYHALSNPILTAWNEGLVRPDASLIVVFAAAEDDASAGAVEHWLSWLRSLEAERNAFAAAAITGEAGCLAPAPRYRELVAGSGGTMVSICRSDLSGGMALIGELLAGRERIILEGSADPSTISVEVDGAAIDASHFSFDPASRMVQLSPLVRPGPGGEVVVRYSPLCL